MLSEAVRRGGGLPSRETGRERYVIWRGGGDMVEFPHDMGLASPFIRPRIDHRESYRS